MRRDTIPKGEQSRLTIAAIDRFLSDSVRPGDGKFAHEAKVAEEHIGNTCAFRAGQPGGYKRTRLVQLGIDDQWAS